MTGILVRHPHPLLTDLPQPYIPQNTVYRVPGFWACRPNWVLPPSHPQGPLRVQRGDTLARGEGEGGANSDDGTDTLVILSLYVTSPHIINIIYFQATWILLYKFAYLFYTEKLCTRMLVNPSRKPSHKESVSRDWAFFWNARVDRVLDESAGRFL